MESMPSQVYETCAQMPRYQVEERAVKVGDTSHSHISLNRDRRVFSQDFSLSFEFRTYYPNGLIFLVKGHNNKVKSHLALGLRGGYIMAELVDRKRVQLITTNEERLNDGQWHNVSLVKANKNMSLGVDRTVLVESSKVRRKLPLKSPVFIGGVPEGLNEINDLNDIDILRESFKGCLKNVHINQEYVDLSSGLMHNVSECFTRIEKGAYFGGQGFAVFGMQTSLRFIQNFFLTHSFVSLIR